jgi:hypothetical protein
LILRHHGATGSGNLLGPAQSVLTHAGKHHRKAARTVRLGRGAEQDINGWPARVFGRPLL